MKPEQCTDHHGIQKNAQRLHYALFAGMFCVRSSGGHGDSPLTCFIRHKPTFYPLCKGCAEETAENSFRCECTAEYCTKEIRNGADIQESDKQYRTAVNHCHDRYHFICHRCDFMDTAKGKKCSAANEEDTCDTVKHRCP